MRTHTHTHTHTHKIMKITSKGKQDSYKNSKNK